METATEMLKIEKPKEAMTSGKRLPLSSDRGAHRIGPVAKLVTR